MAAFHLFAHLSHASFKNRERHLRFGCSHVSPVALRPRTFFIASSHVPSAAVVKCPGEPGHTAILMPSGSTNGVESVVRAKLGVMDV